MPVGSRIGNLFLLVLLGLLLVAGPALLVWGSIATQRHDAIVRDGVRTEGTVTEFVDAMKASRRKVTVAFTDADGRTHVARGLARSGQHPEAGDPATVAYRAGDPEANALPAYDDEDTSLLGMGVILTGVFWGLPLLVVLVRLPGRRRRRRRRAEARAAAAG